MVERGTMRRCVLVALASLLASTHAFNTPPPLARRTLALNAAPRGVRNAAAAARAERGAAAGLRMQGGDSTEWLTSYKPPKEQELDLNNKPPVADLPEETRMLFEDTGIIVDGEWATKEQLQETVKEWLPGGWEECAWPLGSVDIGHINGGERLVDERIGGDASAYPMGPPQVLTYGEALIDQIAVDPSVKLGDRADRWTPYPGGAPLNVACALAKLGTPSAFIGSVGADADGDKILELLEGCKLPTACVQRDTERGTRGVFVTRDAEGGRDFGGFTGDSAGFADTATDLGGVDGTLFYGASWVVTGTLGLAFPSSRDAMLAVRDLCADLDIIRVTDVNHRPVFWEGSGKDAREEILKYIGGTSILKATADEVEFLFGIDRDTAMQQPYQVLKTMGPGCMGVLITDGDQGVSYSFEAHGGLMTPFAVPVVDSTGAGDAFTAGFVHRAIGLSEAFQEEEVDLGEEKPYPRGHMPVRQRVSEAFKDKEVLADAVAFAQAVGAATCMDEGAVGAQPSLRLAERMVEEYGDDIVVTEEGKRDFELPDLKKQWWDWRYSGQ